MISHLGLPPRTRKRLSTAEAREALSEVLSLAAFPGPRVKLSGFYALTDPPHDYPHEAAWAYVEVLLEDFGARRLLWASDFTPCLGNLSFPQTLDLFAKMPFLTDRDRQGIEGGDLMALLDQVGGT